eukprot:155015-Pleurochrysis_carterae.AAC.3
MAKAARSPVVSEQYQEAVEAEVPLVPPGSCSTRLACENTVRGFCGHETSGESGRQGEQLGRLDKKATRAKRSTAGRALWLLVSCVVWYD